MEYKLTLGGKLAIAGIVIMTAWIMALPWTYKIVLSAYGL